jgi:hypothetical protein
LRWWFADIERLLVAWGVRPVTVLVEVHRPGDPPTADQPAALTIVTVLREQAGLRRDATEVVAM